MRNYKKLAHAVWDCKYHIVWCPKYRFRILKGDVGRFIRDIIRQLCEWKNIEIVARNVQVDHIHLVLSIPPKYSVSQAVGFLKGKSAIQGVVIDLSLDQAVLSLAGRISLTGNQGMNISLKNMDLSCLLRFWDEDGQIIGLLSADMNISGTAKDSEIQARVLVKDESGYDFAFSDLDILIRCAESKAFVKAALSREDKKNLNLRGNTGFLISLSPVAIKPLAGTLDANVEISELKFSDLPFHH